MSLEVEKNSVHKDDRLLVIDMNYLPAEYKDESSDEVRQKLEVIYNCKVLLIDSSKVNTQGGHNNKIAYFI